MSDKSFKKAKYKEKILENTIPINCKVCGKEFKPYPIKRINCSRECTKKYKRHTDALYLAKRKEWSKSVSGIKQYTEIPARPAIQVSHVNWPPDRNEITKAMQEFVEGGGEIRKLDKQVAVDLIDDNKFVDPLQVLEAVIVSYKK